MTLKFLIILLSPLTLGLSELEARYDGEASLCRGRAASGRNLAQEFEIDSALIISRPNEQTIERKREIESILET